MLNKSIYQSKTHLQSLSHVTVVISITFNLGLQVVMVLLKVLSQHLHGGTEKFQENFSHSSQSLGWDLNPGLWNTKQEC
jgi:hypothetical protein